MLCGRGGRDYFTEGERVTVFADGQGHNGNVVRIFQSPDKVNWYHVDFDEDKSDKKVGYALDALLNIYCLLCN